MWSIAIISAFLMSCGSIGHDASLKKNAKITNSEICMKTNKPDKVLSFLKSQEQKPPGSKVYIIFESSICLQCPVLRRKIKSISVDATLIYLNIEFTWAFMMSRYIGVRGVPSLVVFMQGIPRFSREGNASILEYLHGNAKENSK